MAPKQLLRFACLLTILLCTAVFVNAQDETKTSGKSKSTSVTGCVQKGTETNGYYITDENGKTWELTESAAKVSPHVGHKVTLTGMATKESKATEAKKETSEKEEAGSNAHAGDFKVSSVKMISESCQ